MPIGMMQATQDRHAPRYARACQLRDRSLARGWYPLPQSLVRVIVGEVRHLLPRDAAQVRLAQHEEMVETLAAHRAEEPLADRVLLRRPVGGAQLLDAACGGDAGEGGSIRTVVVADEAPRALVEG